MHIKKWFDYVDDAWIRYKIDIQDVYNMDETGFQMGHAQKERVVFDRRTGPPSAVTTGNTGSQ
jgi:hypothetical protein